MGRPQGAQEGRRGHERERRGGQDHPNPPRKGKGERRRLHTDPKRVRVGGWSPYGSPIGSRINKDEAAKLQEQISSLFTKQQKAEWRWDKPWLTNYQMILHIDWAQDTNDVFNARA